MDPSKLLSILIQATLITLIYLFIFITAKLFLWDQHDDLVDFRHNGNSSLIGASWELFVSNSLELPTRIVSHTTPHSVLPSSSICKREIVEALDSPRLTTDEYNWCLWAKSPSGGNVNSQSLWGNLASNEEEKWKFRHLRCDLLNTRLESCNDIEGDNYIRNWRRTRVHEAKLSCDSRRPSNQRCYQNNSDLYCELENVMIDFSKYHNATRVNRFGETLNIRSFEQNFMSTDCGTSGIGSMLRTRTSAASVLPISDVYSTQLSSQYCDVILPGPVLLYSHDYLENFGHTLSDIMYVWQMLWLSGLASSVGEVDLLSIDGLFGDRSTNDQDNPFFLHYHRHFRRLLLGREFGQQRVCIGKVYLQPRPNDFYLFHLWHADDKCSSSVGPSSLFQRYNLHVRGLLTGGSSSNHVITDSNVFRIVVIVRKESDNLAGTSSKTSRLILNLQQIQDTMRSAVERTKKILRNDHGNGITEVDVIYQDLSALSYEEQLQLIGRTNILIGMHGAGIPQSLHMSIGSLPNCCGVIEIFPAGEFTLIRAYGNMVRRIGLKYDRIDISKNDSYSHGATVPVDELSSKLLTMVRQVHSEPTCILPTVVEDPFLEA